MTSTTNTGGTIKFVQPKNHNPTLTRNEYSEMDGAYKKVRIRKAKEKKNKIKKGIIIGIIIISLALYLILK